ncbi:uncharacterized protein L201_001455 [Kwoniella dendrophila CBS 6074]|uniref:Xylanolytic transcriptional activator regulatory domain-containing protein n=1 Tax=Kwoniella dendrophila CBS 6074 TaxID=1295534 RepID=A0AAX4JQ42_9TREE
METSTHERGRFYVGPNGFPRFAGSLSGVYLADTVRSDITSYDQNHPTPELYPGIDEAFIHRNNDEPRSDETALYDIYLLKSKDLLEEESLRLRLNRYFAIWHPLFPFLDGAYLLQCFNNSLQLAKIQFAHSNQNAQETSDTIIGSGSDSRSIQYSQLSAFEGLTPEQSLGLTTIFLVIFTIGGIGLDEQNNSNLGSNAADPKIPTIHSTSQATMLGHLVVGACQNSRINDLFGIQALLALELLFYVTRTYRPAMHLSGVITKLAYEAGLHRCPERYASTFTEATDRDLRKRVFYSLYVLDRLLSADFGIPLMLNDSDIDTCVPGGPEKHITPDHEDFNPPNTNAHTSEISNASPIADSLDTRGSKRKNPPDYQDENISPQDSARISAPPLPKKKLNTGNIINDPAALQARNRLLPAYSLSLMAQMIGQAMEQFNKSVSHRVIDASEVLHLRSMLDSWWNDIGLDCDVEIATQQIPSDPRRQLSTLFTCLYHLQIVNLNRPALSLPPSQVQHDHALQAAIASVRVICSTLSNAFFKNSESLYWPGYVDMVFLGSLILVYGARRERARHNPATWLLRDLRRASSLLAHFAKRWRKSDKFSRVVRALIEREEPTSNNVNVSYQATILKAYQ